MFFEEDHFILLDTMATSIVDISKINMEGLIRNIRKKEAIRMLKQIMENNVMLLNLQRQLLELQIAEEKKRRVEEQRREEEKRRRECSRREDE